MPLHLAPPYQDHWSLLLDTAPLHPSDGRPLTLLGRPLPTNGMLRGILYRNGKSAGTCQTHSKSGALTHTLSTENSRALTRHAAITLHHVTGQLTAHAPQSLIRDAHSRIQMHRACPRFLYLRCNGENNSVAALDRRELKGQPTLDSAWNTASFKRLNPDLDLGPSGLNLTLSDYTEQFTRTGGWTALQPAAQDDLSERFWDHLPMHASNGNADLQSYAPIPDALRPVVWVPALSEHTVQR